MMDGAWEERERGENGRKRALMEEGRRQNEEEEEKVRVERQRDLTLAWEEHTVASKEGLGPVGWEPEPSFSVGGTALVRVQGEGLDERQW